MLLYFVVEHVFGTEKKKETYYILEVLIVGKLKKPGISFKNY